MALGKPSEQPQVPAGGWQSDNYVRCSTCQTILVVETISVKMEGANIPIAMIHLCNKCGDISKRWIISGRYVEGMNGKREYLESNADKLKIAKGMITYAMGKYPKTYLFTMEQLKEGSVAITSKPKNIYNPDRFTESEVSEEMPF